MIFIAYYLCKLYNFTKRGIKMIRVISGKYRSRILNQPETDKTRPTMDRVREAIFSSIRNNIEEKIVLDLFAGCGSMAIEAISNGAMKAVCVDSNKMALKAINENVKKLKINNLDIYGIDSLIFLKRYVGKVFDFIFLDPPYKDYDLLNKALELIIENKFLDKYGHIIIETDDPNQIFLPKKLIINKIKKYGKVYVCYISLIH
ncbi:UNVERIFIED_CONTAM: 16S rRNA (guanine(966)-N(2))-methyltransferase RsmD [Campylobacter lari]